MVIFLLELAEFNIVAATNGQWLLLLGEIQGDIHNTGSKKISD